MDTEQLDYIKSSFKSCKKYKPNLYYAFIEKFLTLSNRLIFIVPNSFQSNLSGKYIKELIHKHSVSEIIDFKHNKQFSNADTYTCIIDLSYDNHYYSNSCNRQSKELDSDNHPLINMAHKKLGSNWTLSKNQLVSLATLANNVYLIEKNAIPSVEWNIAISNGIIRRLIDGKNQDDQKYIIFPYHATLMLLCKNDDDKNVILDELYFQQTYPTIYQHLLKHRHILENRDKKKAKNYPVWFQYGRSQGINNPDNIQEILWFSHYYYPNKCEPIFIRLDKCSKCYYALKSGMAININNANEKEFWLDFINHDDVWKFILYDAQLISGGYYRLHISKIKETIKMFTGCSH